jgi:hypothetical protein
MRKSPQATFAHFLFGFVLFISLSVSLTVIVGRASVNQDVASKAAAARATMLEQ